MIEYLFTAGNISKPRSKYCWNMFLSSFFLIIFPVVLCIISAISLVLIYNLLSTHDQSLAIASDVIDCEHLEPWQNFFNSEVEIKQIASDKFNDNSNGLQMDVVSIPERKIVYRKYFSAGNFQATLPRNKLNRFVVPDGYYGRPWYLRKNSNISLQVSVVNYESPPSKMVAYVILGDENVNSFLDPSYPTPHYEYSIDLLLAKDEDHTIRLDRNGYFYVVVEIQTVSQLDFFANVTFDFFYIDSDDYNFTRSKNLGGVGESVRFPLDLWGKNLVLCSVAPLPSEVYHRTIHVFMVYKIRPTVFIAISIVLVLYYLIYLPIMLCLILRKQCQKHQHKRSTGYELLYT